MEIKDILSELITVANNAMNERGCPENFDLEDFISTLEDYYEELDEIGEFIYYDEDGYEPAPCLFRYFNSGKDYNEWHGISDETYPNQDYPIIELDWEMYKQIEDLFGERTITEFGPKFFQDVVHQEVKTIVSE
jgi:hypothetical protein